MVDSNRLGTEGVLVRVTSIPSPSSGNCTQCNNSIFRHLIPETPYTKRDRLFLYRTFRVVVPRDPGQRPRGDEGRREGRQGPTTLDPQRVVGRLKEKTKLFMVDSRTMSTNFEE